MRRPLRTAGGLVATAPLVLIDLYTVEGPVGCAYLFCYTALVLRQLRDLVMLFAKALEGRPLAPLDIGMEFDARFRLLGNTGLLAMVAAGIDMAAWDALAKGAGVPLATLLGAQAKPIPAYNSCGLGIIGAPAAGKQARGLLERGFRAIKVRLGYPTLLEDLAVIRAVRESVGDEISILIDYNQCLSGAEAQQRLRALDDFGLVWVEEPLRAHDFASYAALRSRVRTPIQAGENWWGSYEFEAAVRAGATDFVMADAMKIGGVTGWMRAASIALTAGLPISSHLFPEVSVHLLASSPTAHWLEYVDFAEPILRSGVTIRDGSAVAPDAAGSGMLWDESAVRKYAVA